MDVSFGQLKFARTNTDNRRKHIGNMGCGMSIVQYVLFVFNLLCAVSAESILFASFIVAYNLMSGRSDCERPPIGLVPIIYK